MSQYVTPFLVINLGAEMIYVIAQRLQAQHVSVERSNIVLDEILSSLLSKPLICEIIKPQPVYLHSEVREIIEDVSQSSAMRLDPISMNKLWELITMVFKWQVTLSHELFKITTRHLNEIEQYASRTNTKTQVQRVLNIIDNFGKILPQLEQIDIREQVLAWLQPFSVRVSLLLKLGFQDMDGLFIVNNTDEITKEMLKNLGENIYEVTQNGKILERCLKHDNNKNNFVEEKSAEELPLFIDQIGGNNPRFSGSNEKRSLLKLSIGENQKLRESPKKKIHFENVDIDNINASKSEVVFDDFKLDNANFKDELLDMMESES